MNTYQIINYLQNFKQFMGVYPRDLLPKSIDNCTGIIINTDKSDAPGEHWISIYKNCENVTFYFDSFGLPPLHQEINNFLEKSSLNWFYNAITYQSVHEDTCGMYCIYYLTCMFKYNDYNIFRNIFSANPYQNDIFAKFIYKIQTDLNKN